jgi:hypothetical protein
MDPTSNFSAFFFADHFEPFQNKTVTAFFSLTPGLLWG